MANNLTNNTFPSDDIDDTTQHTGSNSDASQNLKEEDRSKGGKATASKTDMRERGREGGLTAQQNGNAHDLTDEERSEGGSN